MAETLSTPAISMHGSLRLSPRIKRTSLYLWIPPPCPFRRRAKLFSEYIAAFLLHPGYTIHYRPTHCIYTDYYSTDLLVYCCNNPAAHRHNNRRKEHIKTIVLQNLYATFFCQSFRRKTRAIPKHQTDMLAIVPIRGNA